MNTSRRSGGDGDGDGHGIVIVMAWHDMVMVMAWWARLPVMEFIAIVVSGHNVQEEDVFGFGVQTGHPELHLGEHLPEIITTNLKETNLTPT